MMYTKKKSCILSIGLVVLGLGLGSYSTLNILDYQKKDLDSHDKVVHEIIAESKREQEEVSQQYEKEISNLQRHLKDCESRLKSQIEDSEFDNKVQESKLKNLEQFIFVDSLVNNGAFDVEITHDPGWFTSSIVSFSVKNRDGDTLSGAFQIRYNLGELHYSPNALECENGFTFKKIEIYDENGFVYDYNIWGLFEERRVYLVKKYGAWLGLTNKEAYLDADLYILDKYNCRVLPDLCYEPIRAIKMILEEAKKSKEEVKREIIKKQKEKIKLGTIDERGYYLAIGDDIIK